MAIDGLNLAARTSNNAGNGSAPKEERVKAEFWINIGTYSEYVDDAGEVQKRFPTLPFGIAVDTMKDSEQNTVLAKLGNQLLAQLKDHMARFEVGQEINYPIGDTGLFAQFRRNKARVEAPKTTGLPALKFVA